MADAPVQGINIDPNLTVNAFSNGMAANFNYGTGAQADRASAIGARDAQANFNHGAGALQQQAATTGNIQATTGNIQAKTAAQLIANELDMFGVQQQKLEQEKVGNYARENRALAQQRDLQENQELASYNQTPAGQMNIARLVQSKARIDANQAELGAKALDGQLRNQDLSQQTDYARLEVENLGVNKAKATAFNRQKVAGQLNEALQADLQLQSTTGLATSERRIALLDSLAKSDYQAFADNADVLAPVLSDLDQQYGLPPSLRTALGQVKDAATYHTSGTAIQNTVSSIAQARAQGQGSPIDNRIISSLSSIGIDTQDSSDLLNVTVDKTGGAYTFVNQQTGERSPAFSPAEVEGSPALQTIAVASSKRQRTKQNPLTQTDIQQQQLAQIENSPLNGSVGESFGKLIKNISPEISDVQQFTTQATKTFTRFQQDLTSSNPLYSPEGESIFLELGFGQNLIQKGVDAGRELVGIETKKEDLFNQRIETSPELVRDIVDAYANRSTGGMPPSIFNSYVDTLTSQVASSDPRYQVSANNPPAAVADRTKSLRAKIQRSLVIPTNDVVLSKAYEKIVAKYPEMAVQGTFNSTKIASPTGFLSSIASSIYKGVKGAAVGLDQEDVLQQSIVPQR